MDTQGQRPDESVQQPLEGTTNDKTAATAEGATNAPVPPVGQTGERERISPSDFMAPFEGAGGKIHLGQQLTPVQSAGLQLARQIGWIVAGVIAIILVAWIVLSMQTPTQADAVVDRCTKMFETIMGKLAPAFTLIVGYVLGKSDGNKDS